MTSKEKDILLDIILRICKDETNYFDSKFANGTKLYIDGCADYLTDEEKEVVKKWIVKNSIVDFEERKW